MALSARRQGPNLIQAAFAVGGLGLAIALAAVNITLAGSILRVILAGAFFAIVSFRLLCVLTSLERRTDVEKKADSALPHYTVVMALKDEAAVAEQLVSNLAAIDYPSDRLTGLLVVEANDPVTRRAFERVRLPSWLGIHVAPPGAPATKPRALNIALGLARPGLLTVYDAEDEPHPLQLREAAARFAEADRRLACLQAPLRIRRRDRPMTWMERQFALEYAVLFEIVLPALARLGLPLPLGGTSNHFRVESLLDIGGWDPWNVTEDADLGFRLHRLGYRSEMLTLPTMESPPPSLKVWLPQRTRWLKGFMQTLLVHTRRPLELGLAGLTVLAFTLGAAVVSACLQAPFLCWTAAVLLEAAMAGYAPLLPPADLAVAGYGWAVAGLCMAIGAARAGVRTGAIDVLTAPLYWSLHSLAQSHALWRLVRQPFHWDKTPHAPDKSGGRVSRA